MFITRDMLKSSALTVGDICRRYPALISKCMIEQVTVAVVQNAANQLEHTYADC